MTSAPHAPGPVIRLRLAARAPVGPVIVGCNGARLGEDGITPETDLVISIPGGSSQRELLREGQEIETAGVRIRVVAIHPVDTEEAAGVALTWH